MTPPPWTLTGRGVITLSASGVLMLVRYAACPVGPYDELLWAERTRTPAGWRPQVRAIVVSTEQSVVWGRRNWGMPKHLAHFAWTGNGRVGEVRVTGDDGAEVARLEYEVGTWRVPVNTALLPPPLRTLAQPGLDGAGGWLLTTLEASGRLTPARLAVGHLRGLSPAPPRTRPVLTLGVPDFRLVFPVPGGVDNGQA
ncbi:hypothetical protein QOL99_04450 [Deinococcus sp. MIMF12]|uniref:Acetoacetate decarboxylase n=1 Tax=Deinococcus rhizophilus TaxID=3049544 RepID=A0ABT7JFX5_9DEIO|nr:acetoacetate decarboxylase family protein [Deinococcus rhizophilus]MDL2343400.1 hypothetical protein [Deinococcus rhizophilus]